MKEKVVEICIRVSQNEKKILQRKAKKSGLNLSSYLRKVGLEKEIYSVPDKDFHKIYVQISNLKNEIYKLQTDEIIVYLEVIKKNFLDIYNKQITGEKKMATTKIWAVKDSISRVINYAKNPQKTTLTDLEQVLLYAEDKSKTIDADEKTMLVTGVNCNTETAFEEMMLTEKRFDKTTGNVAYHAYQSFKTGEVTPELAHKIGVELAEKMWSEHQVLVATHLNIGTYRNHFVICSVNMFTGEKFNCNKGAYYRFRGLSDELCEKYNLTIIKNPKGKTPRNIYFAEKRGELTKYNLMRKAIDEAMEMCINYGQFKKIMLKKGYVINDDYNRKYATIRSINDKKAVRMYHLGEQYTPKFIYQKVENNPYYYQNRYMDLFHSKKKKKSL